MRIQITVKDSITLPIAHHVELQHAFYSLVDAERVQAWHQYGNAPRPYTFSRLLGKGVVKGRHIHFPRGFQWWIHTLDDELSHLITQNIQGMMGLPLGTQRVRIQRYRHEPTPEMEEQILFHTLSPIVADDNVKGVIVSYAPDEPEFSNHISVNAQKKAKYFLHQSEGTGVTIEPIGGIRKITSWFKTTPIEGYIGTFMLRGKPEILELLFNVGVGRRNGIGFGCIELFE